MSKASTTSVLLHLCLLLHVLMIMAPAGGVDWGGCQGESLGECGNDCQIRCVAKHPDGSATCDLLGSQLLCNCHYDCPPPPPPPKACNGGAGICSAANCWTDCCNSKCEAKYSKGTGFCSDIGGAVLCQCEYPCPLIIN